MALAPVNKTYNTHLVKLWLDNDRDNYYACGDIEEQTLRDDDRLLEWLKEREYGGDREKIIFERSELHLKSIREVIKDNMQAVNA